MKNAIIYAVMFAAIQVMVSTIAQLVWTMLMHRDGVMSTDYMIVALATYNVLVIAVFLIAKWAQVSRNWLLTRPWGVLCWAGVAAVGCIVPSLWIQEMMPELPNLMGENVEGMLGSRAGYAVVGLLAPMAEEVVFRGAILRSLLSWNGNHWLCIAISALIFAAVHINPAQMPHAFAVGLLLGWMYWRTGSILPGVVFHWVNNSIAYAMYNLSMAAYGRGDMTLAELLGQQRVLMAVVFSLLILLPAIYQLNLRMKK